MCGIAGIVNLNGEPVSPVLLKKMTDAIDHRGPDGEGQWVEASVGLGHRRLAIIDPSPAGHQPMISADHRFVLSYNGEVYNFQELRGELEALGHQFHSQTDSEVVLNAWVEWGEDCVLRFNGMFAFAVWDRLENRLHLSRDRYGIKPLYYAQCGSTFLFGSEVKAIIQHPAYRSDVDKEGLLEYFTFQNFFSDKTLYKGVTMFPAGHLGAVCAGEHQEIALRRYWDFCFREPESGEACSDEEYLEELDRLTIQAVNRQLVSDVELGAYLSGGIDSGALTALASRQLPYMKTFTCGFDLRSSSGLEYVAYDEREMAEYMSYVFKTEHYEMVLKSGDMERCLPRLVHHLEEPRVGQSYPNFYVAHLASKFVKVVLGGTGGDELFGGYPWRYYRAVNNRDFDDYIDKYYKFWQRLVPNKDIQRLFSPVWPDVSHVWTRDIFASVFANHEQFDSIKSPEDYVNMSMYFESKTFLHGLLVMKDKLSMAHSIESRVPFLDNDLVDFALRLPVRLKLGNLGEMARLDENAIQKAQEVFQNMRDGKVLLRKCLSAYVPEEIATGAKRGFSGPDGRWFSGESIEYVKSVVNCRQSPMYDYLDRDVIKRLVGDHLSGKANRRLFIWSLLYTHEWFKQNTGHAG